MRIIQEINPAYTFIKSLIPPLEEVKERVTKKGDERAGFIYPPVNRYLSDYVVENNGKLRKCAIVLAQDTVLQNYVFKTENEEDKETVQYKTITDFWNKKNKYQLFLAIQERYTYGYGCLELRYNNNGELKELSQFPSRTSSILRRNNLYYAVQEKETGGIVKLKLWDRLEDYPDDEEHQEMPICLWLGGGTKYEFYDVPVWYSDKDLVLGKINLNLMNAEKINNGNNLDGILAITGPPQRPNEAGEKPEDVLKRQIRDSGTGTMVTYMETANRDFLLDYNYIPISNNNWEYLENYSKSADNAVMSNFSIPKVRLMIDDTTESMNSNKTDTIWQIYAISLGYEQFPNELIIQKFNKIFFDMDMEVDMQIPIFSDKTQIEVETIKNLYLCGLLTMGQAITKLQEFYPELQEYDLDSLTYNERYFNGQPLGFDKEDSELNKNLDKVGSILNLFEAEEYPPNNPITEDS